MARIKFWDQMNLNNSDRELSERIEKVNHEILRTTEKKMCEEMHKNILNRVPGRRRAYEKE